jgi:arylsulfatase A-like enzyme
VCSPTRFALITGRYQYRLRGGMDEPLSSKARTSSTLGLPPEHPTMPSLLRAAGYKTALVGKWHLGYPPHFGPLKSGYEEHFGLLGGGADYFTHKDRAGVRDLWENGVESKRTGYMTDLISDHAVDYIGQRGKDKAPFLLSVHYTAPHWPWETRADEAEAQRIGAAIHHVDGGSVATYRTMINHMDEGVGRIMTALKAAGLAENTLTIFTSDNGGERFSDTWPFVGRKMDALEGGIRVSLLAHWPGTITAGGVTAQTAITMDWMPTFLAVAGVKPHKDYPPDGTNLMPVLADPKNVKERALFWRMNYRNQRAVRIGNWKYLSIEGDEFLYDLSYDSRERANFGKRYPGRLEELRARYLDWEATMPPLANDANVSTLYGKADMATGGA